MILLTDGVTYGDSDRCRQLARDAAAAGIAIYPLGIGADWDEDLLDSIGQLSGGMPAEFIRDPSDALNIFEQQLQSAVDVAIRNATLILRLPVGVTAKKAVKVLPIISDLGQSVLSDRQVVIPLGDLEKDKPQSVLVELLIDPRPAGLFRIAQTFLGHADVFLIRQQVVVGGHHQRDDVDHVLAEDALGILLVVAGDADEFGVSAIAESVQQLLTHADGHARDNIGIKQLRGRVGRKNRQAALALPIHPARSARLGCHRAAGSGRHDLSR